MITDTAEARYGTCTPWAVPPRPKTRENPRFNHGWMATGHACSGRTRQGERRGARSQIGNFASKTLRARRQRARACIRRVSLAGVDLGTKPDGNKAKLWLAVSQPPEKRRRAALAGKVKRLYRRPVGPPPLDHRSRMGHRSGSTGTRVASATTMQLPGATTAGCGWDHCASSPCSAERGGKHFKTAPSGTWEFRHTEDVPNGTSPATLVMATWNVEAWPRTSSWICSPTFGVSGSLKSCSCCSCKRFLTKAGLTLRKTRPGI